MTHQEIIKDITEQISNWRAELLLLQNENVRFKHKVTELTAAELPQEALAELEEFHNKLIRKDELLLLIRQDIRHLEQEIAIPGADASRWKESAARISNEIDKLGYQFSLLKRVFRQYVS